MQPAQAPKKSIKTKKFSKQRHFLAVFFLSFMWGMFGVDRMYLGKWGTGILKLVTFGGFGLWVVVDLLLIMSGAMRDKWGRPMLQFAEYKAFAYWTVLIFAVVLGIVVLVNGILLIAGVSQLIYVLQSGDTSQLLPGLEGVNGLQGSGLSPEELQQLGL